MSVVSTPDRIRIRTAKRQWCEPVLNVAPLRVVATAEIASTPVNNPVAFVVVTNTSSGWLDVAEGMAFRIDNASGQHVTWGIIRRAVTATGAIIDVKSQGDAGIAAHILRAITAGCTLTVYAHRPMFALFSRATAEENYKQWDLRYEGSNSAPAPVVVMGGHRQAWETLGAAALAFDASDSYDWLAGTAGVAEVQWDFGGEETVITGGLDELAVTVSLPVGSHPISCRITSLNGRSATGYRWVFVNSHADPDGLPFSSRYAIGDISGDTRTRQGREMTFSLKGDARADLAPGLPVLFTHPVLFDGVELGGGVAIRDYAGYIEEVSFSSERRNLTTSLSTKGPLRIAPDLPSATQLMQESATPADWTEVIPQLMEPIFAAYYVLKHHTTLLWGHDFTWVQDIRELRRRVFGFRSDSIGPQLRFLEDVCVGEFNCRSDGRLQFLLEPNHQENAYKNALDEKFTWTDADVTGPLAASVRLRPRVGHVIRDALSHDGSDIPATYRAIAPGYAQAQGAGKDDLPDISLPPGSGQLDLNRIVGHSFAYQNNPLAGLPLGVASMADILEPADDDWHLLDVPDEYLPFDPQAFGIDWDAVGGMRFRPERVSCQWRQDRGRWLPKLSAQIRMVSAGQPGQYLPVARDDAFQWLDGDGWLIGEDDPYLPDTPDLDLDETFASAFTWVTRSEAGLCESFIDDKVHWAIARGDVVGRVVWADWDYQALGNGVWMLVWDDEEDELRLYNSSDPFDGSPLWVLRRTIDVSSVEFAGNAMVASSPAGNGLVALAYLSSDGMIVERYWSSTWQTPATIGVTAAPSDLSSRFGLLIDGTEIYVPGMTAADEWKLYTATTSGAFSAIANQPGDGAVSSSPPPFIARDGLGNTLTAVELIDDTPASETVSTWPTGNDLDGSPPVDFPNESDDPAAVDMSTYYGYSRLARTNEQVANVSYGVDAFTASFRTTIRYPADDGDPPGNSGSPEVYFPPGGGGGDIFTTEQYRVEVTAYVALLDKNRNVLWAAPVAAWDTLDTGLSYTITYSPSPMGFDRVAFEIEVTINKSFATTLQGVRYVEVRFLSDSKENFASGSFNPASAPELDVVFFDMFGGPDSMDISNKRVDGWRLYKIDDGTETWTDITPDGEFVPIHPGGMSAASTTLTMIAANPSGKRQVMYSLDGGTNWFLRRTTTYKWLKRLASGVFVAGGPNKLDITVDSFVTVEPRIGNWTGAVGGGINDFEGVLVLVET